MSTQTQKIHKGTLKPESSGPVTIDGVRWKSVLNFIYASLTNDPASKRKIQMMHPSELRKNVNAMLEAKTTEITRHATTRAYEEKFKHPQMAELLLRTGTVTLKSNGLYETSNGTSIDTQVLSDIRTMLRNDAEQKIQTRDRQAYIRRVKQAARIANAMKKILDEGDSLSRFENFSIASIPTELTRIPFSTNIDSVPPEIKSAALTLNGNILYNYVRKMNLRKYRDSLEQLHATTATQIVAAYILNTRFPHFFEECVEQHTRDIRGDICSLELSLENPDLDYQLRRERMDALDALRNEQESLTATLTKKKMYKRQTELLESIPDVHKKVWSIYKKGKFPPEIMDAINNKINSIYFPSDLEIKQAEAWTHQCQTYKPSKLPQTKKHNEFVLSDSEFPELQTDYPFDLKIEGKIYASPSHYVLSKLTEHLIKLSGSNITPDDILTTLTGTFKAVPQAIKAYKDYEHESYVNILSNAVEIGLAHWMEHSTSAKKVLVESTGDILYASDNMILGMGPHGDGNNIVGNTLVKLRRILMEHSTTNSEPMGSTTTQ